MIKDLLKILKIKKGQVKDNEEIKKEQVKDNEEIKPIENDINKLKDAITVTEENGFYKIIINESISVRDYQEIEKNSEYKDILDLICTTVLFNSGFHGTNVGTFYVKEIDNTLYNILLTNNEMTIKERIKCDIDDDEKNLILNNLSFDPKNLGDYVYHDKTLTLNKSRNKYRYSHLRHMFDWDTYDIKIYEKNTKTGMGKLELTDLEAYEEIKEFLDNLEGIEKIENILDTNSLRMEILDDLKEKTHNTTRI